MDRQSDVDGVPFEYTVSGRSGGDTRTLLLLPGLLGDAGSLWQQAAEFERDHRVISLTYPDTPSVRHQLDAIARVLDEQGVERAVVIGQTLGGFLAQAFARAFPERVEALVLVHAGLPDPKLGATVRRDIGVARFLPWFLIRGYLHRALRKMIAGLAADPAVDARQAETVVGHFRDRFAHRLDKRRVLARYGLMANLHQARPFERAEVSGLQGRVLILYSESNVFGRQLGRLRELYPGSREAAMGRRHNIALLIKPGESHRQIRDFLGGLPQAPAAHL